MILSPMYHGTAEHITRFDPSRTGGGIDQYGSGFYFDSIKGHAETYALIAAEEKRGDTPNVVCANIELKHPIEFFDKSELDLDSIRITPQQTIKILLRIPGLRTCDMEESILGDYLPEIWQKPPKNDADTEYYIRSLVHQYFMDTNLQQLDFLCAKWPTEFRTAVHEITGWDGVIVHYPESMQVVAWFPDQITITDTFYLKTSKEEPL